MRLGLTSFNGIESLPQFYRHRCGKIKVVGKPWKCQINIEEVMGMDSKKPEYSTDLGMVRMSNEVVSVAASMAASEVEGVAAMASSGTTGLIEKLSRKNLHKGVAVEAAGETALIDVYITVYFGYAMPGVAGNVQRAVKAAVENLTGLTVGAVNVHVVAVTKMQDAEAAKASAVQAD